ncbi:GNAT family N-acetyltransferase [Streptomyces indicus]|uniref:L-amino acid N-acyltransferase YncA n=1 Tax=Streptomyces indicus TaxID=417292 RepID=A0A1G8X4N0_9ACTN|nr:GNAT family N-acetyltransferase [Streptomyces indicus]SDJ85578.1 L-amino acid N-acyltransferase YncA [Streptomyces indicus]
MTSPEFHEQPAIRRAEAADADALTALMHASRAYRGAYASILQGYRVTPDYVARHRVFLAEDAHGTLLGFYALVCSPPELDLAFVADEAQGRGAGRLLLTHMLDEARAAGLPGVRVVSHPPSEGFYRALGARRTGTLPASPPKVTWERPELWFDLSATATPATTAAKPDDSPSPPLTPLEPAPSP